MAPPPLETPGIDTNPSLRVRIRRALVLRSTEVVELVGIAVTNWFRHNVPRLGASLAFYTLLSLAPLLIIVVAVAGAVFGREAAQGQLLWQIADLIGQEGANTIRTVLETTQRPAAGFLATTLGGLALFYGATAVVAELRNALNIIWCVPQSDEVGLRSLVSVLKDRTFAFAMVLGVGFLLLVMLAVNAALAALGDHYEFYLPLPAWGLRVIDFVLSYTVITFLFALIYKYVPDIHIEWRDVILGAGITSLLFGTGKTLIGMYLGTASVTSAYGAAGSLVAVLLWVYYSAQIFFLGAEFTQAFAQTYGSHPCDRIGREVRVVSDIDSELHQQPGEELNRHVEIVSRIDPELLHHSEDTLKNGSGRERKVDLHSR
jgi:membrane protein